MKYLFGLSIQGIQNFIFETSKLKEIVGASKLVNNLPKVVVEKLLGKDIDQDSLLINAAGNFKCIFEKKEDLERVFTNLPREFYRKAQGLVVSQSFVELENDILTKEDITQLELQLKTQRNAPKLNGSIRIMGAKTSPKTGEIVLYKEGKDFLDKNQSDKRVANKSSSMHDQMVEIPDHYNFTDNIEELADKKNKNWVAIIHADGNNLGQKIIKMSDTLTDSDVKAGFKKLSQALKEATENAVKNAFWTVIEPIAKNEKYAPIRPIIIGGDDITIITRGDLALDFTEQFLENFEAETKGILAKFDEKFHLNGIFSEGLTACAGIAYIKSHYPFHYGISLAESLCKAAKRESKSISGCPSSLMFHKVYSSFISDWEEMEKTELTAGKVSLVNGPYFLNTTHGSSIANLRHMANIINEKSAPKSNIRQWLSLLSQNETRAEDLMRRTINLFEPFVEQLKLKTPISNGKTHLYDVLAVANLRIQK